jgi:hypothetical protein
MANPRQRGGGRRSPRWLSLSEPLMSEPIPSSVPSASESPLPPRRRSLLRRLLQSSLLLVLLLLAVGVGLARFTADGREAWTWLVEQVCQSKLNAAELDAVEQLRGRGAMVVTELPDHHATSLDFRGMEVDDEMLREAARLYRLQHVNLINSNVTDEQLGYLTGLRHLGSVVLNGTPVTDDGAVYLEQIESLGSITARNTKIGDAGLDRLVRLSELTNLDLSGTQVTDAGLARLVELRNLTHVLLEDDAITDAGLAHLEKIPSLRRLTIRGKRKGGDSKVNVTDAGIDRLKQTNPALIVD